MMSNLGAYQWMTTVAKKVGGPVNLLLLTGTAGALIYKSGELAVKKCVKIIRKSQSTKQKAIESMGELYTVTSVGKSNDGLEFIIGDQFRVIETDRDSVLIEKIGDENNPFFVSAELLCTISNYKEVEKYGKRRYDKR